MHDIETRTLNRLIRLKQSEIAHFLNNPQIKTSLFSKMRREYKYVRAYVSKHGQMPSKAMLRRNFPDFPLLKVRDPIDALVTELMQKAQRNVMVNLINDVGSDESLLDNLDECIGKLNAAAIKVAQYDPKTVDFEYSHSFDQRLQSYNDRKHQATTLTFPTGCDALDVSLNGGARSPQLFVLAGDPKMGKTWWLVNMINKQLDLGKVPLVISLEMSTEEIMQRVDALRYQLPHASLIKADLSKKQEVRWKTRAKRDSAKLYVSDSTEDNEFTPSKLLGKIEMYKPNIVFIDSAYYMRPDGADSKHTSYLDNFALVRQLKNIAKIKRLPIVCTVQMKRETELSGLQGEGALRGIYGGDHWSQGADVVVRLTGARAEAFRKLVLLANREGIPFKEHYVKYNFDPYPEINTVDEIVAEEAELEDGDEVVEVEA